LSPEAEWRNAEGAEERRRGGETACPGERGFEISDLRFEISDFRSQISGFSFEL
jgi:hypothetical protein